MHWSANFLFVKLNWSKLKPAYSDGIGAFALCDCLWHWNAGVDEYHWDVADDSIFKDVIGDFSFAVNEPDWGTVVPKHRFSFGISHRVSYTFLRENYALSIGDSGEGQRDCSSGNENVFIHIISPFSFRQRCGSFRHPYRMFANVVAGKWCARLGAVWVSISDLRQPLSAWNGRGVHCHQISIGNAWGGSRRSGIFLR